MAQAALALVDVHHEAVAQQPVVLEPPHGHKFSPPAADCAGGAPVLTVPRLSVTSRLLGELSFTPARKPRDSRRASCRGARSPCSAGVVFSTS